MVTKFEARAALEFFAAALCEDRSVQSISVAERVNLQSEKEWVVEIRVSGLGPASTTNFLPIPCADGTLSNSRVAVLVLLNRKNSDS